MYAQLNPYIFIALSYSITIICIIGYAVIHILKARNLQRLIKDT